VSEANTNALDAEYILHHRLFVGAFNTVRESYIQAIEEGDITDNNRRDKLMLGLQNLKVIKSCLEAHIANAELAANIPEEF
jgi:hypothetical protein